MSIFKQTFKPFVSNQIIARQDLVNYEDGRGLRPIEFAQYTSGKACWSRMTSMVNYDSPDGKYKGDTLARKYVLQGGTLYSKNTGTSIEDYSLRQGVGTTKNASYGARFGPNMYGLRPMPGITKIDVKSRTAYGSLRDATITFMCFEKSQLDELEILFMRPGYTVLLEWGWSMYLNTKEYKKGGVDSLIGKGLTQFQGATINPFQTNLSQDVLYEKFEEYKEKFCGNYDAMYGTVKNFNWELLPNGGFLCTTSLVSVGEVIDSIKVNSSTFPENVNDTKEVKTDFEKFIDDIVMGNIQFQVGYPITTIQPNVINLQQKIQDPSKPSGDVYIQFGYFIYLLQRKVNIFSDDKTIYKIEIPLPHDNSIGNSYCLASDDTISVDPDVCIIKNSKATFVTKNPLGYDPNAMSSSPSVQMFVNTPKTLSVNPNSVIIPPSNSSQIAEFIEGKFGVIGQIYLNINYIKNVYTSMLSNKGMKNEVHLSTFLDKLLEGMSASLGNINSFGLFITDNKMVIIDKNYCEVDTTPGNKFMLNLIGTNSVIRRAGIQSKIFTSQSNMIAVAAGVRNNLGSVQTSTQVKLNEGMSNRIFSNPSDIGKDPTVLAKEKEDTERKDNDGYTQLELEKKKLIEHIVYLRDFVHDKIMTFQQLSEAEKDNARSALTELILKVNIDTNYKAVIPISFEVEMDGISGIIIGEVFRVNPDVLPKAYHNKNVGFIVTGLAHSLQRNDWTTTITALMVLLDQNGLMTQKQLDSLKQFKLDVVNGVIDNDNKRYQDKLRQVFYYNMCVGIFVDLVVNNLGFKLRPLNVDKNKFDIVKSDKLVGIPKFKEFLYSFKPESVAFEDDQAVLTELSDSLNDILSKNNIFKDIIIPVKEGNNIKDLLYEIVNLPKGTVKYTHSGENIRYHLAKYKTGNIQVLDSELKVGKLDILKNSKYYKLLDPDFKNDLDNMFIIDKIKGNSILDSIILSVYEAFSDDITLSILPKESVNISNGTVDFSKKIIIK